MLSKRTSKIVQRVLTVLFVGAFVMALVGLSGHEVFGTSERHPLSVIDAATMLPLEGATIIAKTPTDSTVVDTAYEEGDGMYWFEVAQDSGWSSGRYDVWVNGVLNPSWRSVWLGSMGTPIANTVDSSHVKDGSLIGADLKDKTVDSADLADTLYIENVDTDTLRAAMLFESGDITRLGGVAADTAYLVGTFEAANTAQLDKMRFWQDYAGGRMMYFKVGAGKGIQAQIDSSGSAGRFFDCNIDSTVDNASSGAFMVTNRSDSANAIQLWTYGVAPGLYVQNFNNSGIGARFYGEGGYGASVEIGEYGWGLLFRQNPEKIGGSWGAGDWYCKYEIRDSSYGCWMDQNGPNTKGLYITRDNSGGGSPLAAFDLRNHCDGYRVMDILDTEDGSSHTILSLRHGGGTEPYSEDSALVDVRVGPCVGGVVAASTHSGIRFQGCSALGIPVMRLRNTTSSTNGPALVVQAATPADHYNLARFIGGYSSFAGVMSRRWFYDETPHDTLQVAGTAAIYGWYDCDTLKIWDASDIIIVTRRLQTTYEMAAEDSCCATFLSVDYDIGNNNAYVVRSDTTDDFDLHYSWVRIRHLSGSDATITP